MDCTDVPAVGGALCVQVVVQPAQLLYLAPQPG
jgi:hypothetical protein